MLRLALAQSDLDREEKVLADLVGAVENSGAELLALLKQGAPAQMLNNTDAFRISTWAAAGRQKETTRKAAGEVAEAREEFRRAHQEAEVIRKLQEKSRRQHRKELLKEMQKETDEIGARPRKAAEGASTRTDPRHGWRKK